MRGMNIIRKAWEEVGQALNVDPKICQKKWKNLRDTFLRKYKDEKSYIASGSAATKKAMNWKYYQQMQFLKPTAEHRRTFSNIQMVADVNERLPEIRSRTNTEKRYIEDRPSPSSLTIRDGNESISTLSPSLICKTVQDNLPSSPSSRGSTLSSTSCSSQKRKKSEVAVNITSKPKKSYTECPDKFEEFIMGQVTQPESEAATFCNFIKTRLEKLKRQYYLEATHNIMNEFMKLETKAEEETSKK